MAQANRLKLGGGPFVTFFTEQASLEHEQPTIRRGQLDALQTVVDRLDGKPGCQER